MSKWYYEYNGSTKGPVSERDIQRLIEDGTIESDTGLWSKRMDDWQPAASVDTFSDEFQQPPPLPEDQSDVVDPSSMESSSSSSSEASSERSSTNQGEPDIPSHMTKAILTTLFCCLPLGIVAIVKASRVSSTVNNGDYEEARELSEGANKWANISIGVGVVVGVIYFLITIAANP